MRHPIDPKIACVFKALLGVGGQWTRTTELRQAMNALKRCAEAAGAEATRHCVEGADAVICVLGSRHGSRADVAELVLKQLTDLSDLHQTPAVT